MAKNHWDSFSDEIRQNWSRYTLDEITMRCAQFIDTSEWCNAVRKSSTTLERIEHALVVLKAGFLLGREFERNASPDDFLTALCNELTETGILDIPKPAV